MQAALQPAYGGIPYLLPLQSQVISIGFIQARFCKKKPPEGGFLFYNLSIIF